MSHEHRVVDRVNFGLVVTSDRIYRGEAEDKITPMVKTLVISEGHKLVFTSLVPNDYEVIRRTVGKALEVSDAVIVTGGTGVSSKDLIVNVVDSFKGYDLPGFGELFRYLSWNDVGARAWLSRAKARIINDRIVFALPGSPSAVELALKRLILPVIRHLIWELRH